MRYGQIADENKSNTTAMKNRMERFREKLRLDLAGAKTEAHVRFALVDLFSRGGNNCVLRDGWTTVSGTYQAPSRATQVIVELHSRWAPNSEVRWSNVALTETDLASGLT